MSVNSEKQPTNERANNASKTDPIDDQVQWQQRADQAQEMLAAYWNEDNNMFDNAYPCQDCNDMFHYWWQAHAIDVLVDGYERTGDETYIERASTLFSGVVRRNGGLTNDYYDDMLWMALALLRLYEHSDEEAHREAVDDLWNDIKQGWNDHEGGGVAWRKTQLDYKNTPSNGPAVILAARLYDRFGDDEDLQWAKRNFEWLREHLIDPETGFAWDGVNRNGDGQIDKDWAFTYNQGVYIGAGVELYRITGSDHYVQEALRTAKAVDDELVHNVTDLLPSEGTEDGGLFKGILIRYMTELIREKPEETSRWASLIEHNAQTMWEQASETEKILFAPSWGSKADQPVSLSVQLSGIKLLEHVVKIAAFKNS